MRCPTLLAVVGLALATANFNNAAFTQPPFDWTQFLKGVKRAATTDVQPNSEELDIDYQDSQFQMKPIASNPMSPFLAMKPFIPTKPTFMPPVVDPQFFIDKKTALLNGLFSSSPAADKTFGAMPMGPNYFAGKKTAFLSTLFSQLATPAPQTEVKKNSTMPNIEKVIQRRMVAPWLTTPSPFDPKIMTDKKTAFLDKLFSSIGSSEPDTNTVGIAMAKPTIVPPDFWVPFATKSKVALQPTVKPTIVPPNFWFPYSISKDTSTPLKPSAPVVDPSVFIDKKTKFLNDLMGSLNSAPVSNEPITSSQMKTSTTSNSDSISMDDEKLSEFLDKLLTALTTPALMIKRAIINGMPDSRKRSVPPNIESQPTEPPSASLSPKDKIMNTFIGELAGIKNNIVDTVTQMIKTQKESAKVAPGAGAKPGKKIGPPFGSPFAGIWGPMGKLAPTPDPSIPFEQKIDVLNQVFDMLTNLQKDVVTALNEAQTSQPVVATTQAKNDTNTTILDLLRKKFMEMDDEKSSPPKQMYGSSVKYNVRDTSDLPESENEGHRTRSIKMAVHQGYQSLPPGTTELLQAGGGSSPHGKEGGGIKLQKESMNYYDTWQSRHHHHHGN